MGGGLFDAYKAIDLTPYLGALPYSPRPSDRDPQTPYRFYIQQRNHNIRGELITRQLDDPLNRGKPDPERVLLTYRIGDEEHDIFTVKDVIHNTHQFLEEQIGNIRGMMYEGISRAIVKERLQRDGARWIRFSDDHKRDHYTIATTDEYELKTLTYPNAVVLEKRYDKEGRAVMVAMTDIDGLFEAEHEGESYTIIVEAKSGKWRFQGQKLRKNLLTPLESLLDNDRTAYIMFSTAERAFHQYQLTKQQVRILPAHIQSRIPKSRIVRRLTQEGAIMHRTLERSGIEPILFSCSETIEQIDAATKFLMNIYKWYKDRPLGEFQAMVSDSLRGTIIREGAATPA